MPTSEEESSFAEKIKRRVWTSGLSCLVAAVSATQSAEKPFTYTLIPGLLARLLPSESVELKLTRRVISLVS